jgi:hypothetical protein
MDTTEISVSLLTELFNYRREYFLICDEFKIPLERRVESSIAKSIIERIHQYLTSYVMRRSIAERENGAAFPTPPAVVITDPEIEP